MEWGQLRWDYDVMWDLWYERCVADLPFGFSTAAVNWTWCWIWSVVNTVCRKCWSRSLKLHCKSHSCANTLAAKNQMSSPKDLDTSSNCVTSLILCLLFCSCFVCSPRLYGFTSDHAFVLCSCVPCAEYHMLCTAAQLLLFYLPLLYCVVRKCYLNWFVLLVYVVC